MAKIRGNKYISVEERKSLDDISKQRNADVSLGTKLYDLTNKLASEIEGEPISESFPKSVHDLEDHSSIPGVPAAEVFTQEVHDSEDHSTLPGIPSVTGLLDETSHDALDHTGLTGVPAAEIFTEEVHEETDHTGIEGCGGAAEVFTQEVHDLEDHSTLPGIPSVTGLLDETSHDALDHTGLTGIPAEETFTEGAHALVDHSSQLGVPSTAGLLDETAHDALDHAGLTGIPSVTGLLDETAHDALDHTGITGIPSITGLVIGTVAQASNLPVLSDEVILDLNNGSSGNVHTVITDTTYVAFPFSHMGSSEYYVKVLLNSAPVAVGMTIRANNGGVPGAILYSANKYFATVTDEVYFSGIDLINGTYWICFEQYGAESWSLKVVTSSPAGGFITNNSGSTWNSLSNSPILQIHGTFAIEDGDVYYTEDVYKFKRYNSATDTWIDVNPDEAYTEVEHAETDHAGLTGIILEIVETHEDLPTDGFYWAQGYGTAVGSKECNTSYDFADDFVGKGEHNYAFKLKHNNITNNTCTVEIHADNSGEPAAAVLHTLSHVINSPAAEIETEFDFGVLNLTDATTYWITISYNANSGTLLAGKGTSKEKFGEGSWEDHSGSVAFVLIISTTIENSKVYLCQEENVIYGVDDTNTKVKKLTIPVIEIPKDTMYRLDSQDLSAYLPADNSSGDMVALISMSDEDFFFGVYANPIYIYMWRSNWAVPGWQLINPVLPTQGPGISYTNYSAPKGTMWLKETSKGTFRLIYQGNDGQGVVGEISDADVEDASGYNVWFDSLVDLQAYESDYGYGAVHFVWEEKCLYYYDDDTDPENPIWVKLAPTGADVERVSGYNVWFDSLGDLQAYESDYGHGAVHFVWEEKCLYYYDDDTDPENPIWVKLAPLQAANQAASTATTLEGLLTDFNALLTKLKNAGMMAADA